MNRQNIVRLSEDTIQYLRTRASPGESVNVVIRRLLGLPLVDRRRGPRQHRSHEPFGGKNEPAMMS